MDCDRHLNSSEETPKDYDASIKALDENSLIAEPSISPDRCLRAALSSSRTGAVAEVFETVQQQLELVLKQGSPAYEFHHCDNPKLRSKIKTDLKKMAESEDLAKALPAIEELKAITFAEAATRLVETINSDNPKAKSDRYDAFRLLCGLSNCEPGNDGPATKSINALRLLDICELQSELNAAGSDRRWGHFYAKQDASRLVSGVLSGDGQSLKGLCDLNRSQLDQGDDRLAVLALYCRSLASLMQEDGVQLESGRPAAMVNTLNDWRKDPQKVDLADRMADVLVAAGYACWNDESRSYQPIADASVNLDFMLPNVERLRMRDYQRVTSGSLDTSDDVQSKTPGEDYSVVNCEPGLVARAVNCFSKAFEKLGFLKWNSELAAFEAVTNQFVNLVTTKQVAPDKSPFEKHERTDSHPPAESTRGMEPTLFYDCEGKEIRITGRVCESSGNQIAIDIEVYDSQGNRTKGDITAPLVGVVKREGGRTEYQYASWADAQNHFPVQRKEISTSQSGNYLTEKSQLYVIDDEVERFVNLAEKTVNRETNACTVQLSSPETVTTVEFDGQGRAKRLLVEGARTLEFEFNEQGKATSIKLDGRDATAKVEAEAMTLAELSVTEIRDRAGVKEPALVELVRPTGPRKGEQPTGTLVFQSAGFYEQYTVRNGVVYNSADQEIGKASDDGEVELRGHNPFNILASESSAFHGVGTDGERLDLVSRHNKSKANGMLISPDGREALKVVGSKIYDTDGRMLGNLNDNWNIDFCENNTLRSHTLQGTRNGYQFIGEYDGNERAFTIGARNANGHIYLPATDQLLAGRYTVSMGMLIDSNGEQIGWLEPPLESADGNLEGGSITVASADGPLKMELAHLKGARFDLTPAGVSGYKADHIRGISLGSERMVDGNFKDGHGLFNVSEAIRTELSVKKQAEDEQRQIDSRSHGVGSVFNWSYWFGMDGKQIHGLKNRAEEADKHTDGLSAAVNDEHLTFEKVNRLIELTEEAKRESMGELAYQRDKLDHWKPKLETLPEHVDTINGSVKVPAMFGAPAETWQIKSGKIYDAQDREVGKFIDSAGRIQFNGPSGQSERTIAELEGNVWHLEFPGAAGGKQVVDWMSLGTRGVASKSDLKGRSYKEDDLAYRTYKESQSSDSLASLHALRDRRTQFDDRVESLFNKGITDGDIHNTVKFVAEGPAIHVRQSPEDRNDEPVRLEVPELCDQAAIDSVNGKVRVGQNVYQIKNGKLFLQKHERGGTLYVEDTSCGRLLPGYRLELGTKGEPARTVELSKTPGVLLEFTLGEDKNPYQILGLGEGYYTEAQTYQQGGLIDIRQLSLEAMNIKIEAKKGNQDYFEKKPYITGPLGNWAMGDRDQLLRDFANELDESTHELARTLQEGLFRHGFDSQALDSSKFDDRIRRVQMLVRQIGVQGSQSQAMASEGSDIQAQVNDAVVTSVVTVGTAGIGTAFAGAKAATSFGRLGYMMMEVGASASWGAASSAVLRSSDASDWKRNATAGAIDGAMGAFGNQGQKFLSALDEAANAVKALKAGEALSDDAAKVLSTTLGRLAQKSPTALQALKASFYLGNSVGQSAGSSLASAVREGQNLSDVLTIDSLSVGVATNLLGELVGDGAGHLMKSRAVISKELQEVLRREGKDTFLGGLSRSMIEDFSGGLLDGFYNELSQQRSQHPERPLDLIAAIKSASETAALSTLLSSPGHMVRRQVSDYFDGNRREEEHKKQATNSKSTSGDHDSATSRAGEESNTQQKLGAASVKSLGETALHKGNLASLKKNTGTSGDSSSRSDIEAAQKKAMTRFERLFNQVAEGKTGWRGQKGTIDYLLQQCLEVEGRLYPDTAPKGLVDILKRESDSNGAYATETGRIEYFLRKPVSPTGGEKSLHIFSTVTHEGEHRKNCYRLSAMREANPCEYRRLLVNDVLQHTGHGGKRAILSNGMVKLESRLSTDASERDFMRATLREYLSEPKNGGLGGRIDEIGLLKWMSERNTPFGDIGNTANKQTLLHRSNETDESKLESLKGNESVTKAGLTERQIRLLIDMVSEINHINTIDQDCLLPHTVRTTVGDLKDIMDKLVEKYKNENAPELEKNMEQAIHGLSIVRNGMLSHGNDSAHPYYLFSVEENRARQSQFEAVKQLVLEETCRELPIALTETTKSGQEIRKRQPEELFEDLKTYVQSMDEESPVRKEFEVVLNAINWLDKDVEFFRSMANFQLQLQELRSREDSSLELKHLKSSTTRDEKDTVRTIDSEVERICLPVLKAALQTANEENLNLVIGHLIDQKLVSRKQLVSLSLDIPVPEGADKCRLQGEHAGLVALRIAYQMIRPISGNPAEQPNFSELLEDVPDAVRPHLLAKFVPYEHIFFEPIIKTYPPDRVDDIVLAWRGTLDEVHCSAFMNAIRENPSLRTVIEERLKDNAKLRHVFKDLCETGWYNRYDDVNNVFHSLRNRAEPDLELASVSKSSVDAAHKSFSVRDEGGSIAANQTPAERDLYQLLSQHDSGSSDVKQQVSKEINKRLYEHACRMLEDMNVPPELLQFDERTGLGTIGWKNERSNTKGEYNCAFHEIDINLGCPGSPLVVLRHEIEHWYNALQRTIALESLGEDTFDGKVQESVLGLIGSGRPRLQDKSIVGSELTTRLQLSDADSTHLKSLFKEVLSRTKGGEATPPSDVVEKILAESRLDSHVQALLGKIQPDQLIAELRGELSHYWSVRKSMTIPQSVLDTQPLLKSYIAAEANRLRERCEAKASAESQVRNSVRDFLSGQESTEPTRDQLIDWLQKHQDGGNRPESGKMIEYLADDMLAHINHWRSLQEKSLQQRLFDTFIKNKCADLFLNEVSLESVRQWFLNETNLNPAFIDQLGGKEQLIAALEWRFQRLNNHARFKQAKLDARSSEPLDGAVKLDNETLLAFIQKRQLPLRSAQDHLSNLFANSMAGRSASYTGRVSDSEYFAGSMEEIGARVNAELIPRLRKLLNDSCPGGLSKLHGSELSALELVSGDPESQILIARIRVESMSAQIIKGLEKAHAGASAAERQAGQEMAEAAAKRLINLLQKQKRQLDHAEDIVSILLDCHLTTPEELSRRGFAGLIRPTNWTLPNDQDFNSSMDSRARSKTPPEDPRALPMLSDLASDPDHPPNGEASNILDKAKLSHSNDSSPKQEVSRYSTDSAQKALIEALHSKVIIAKEYDCLARALDEAIVSPDDIEKILKLDSFAISHLTKAYLGTPPEIRPLTDKALKELLRADVATINKVFDNCTSQHMKLIHKALNDGLCSSQDLNFVMTDPTSFTNRITELMNLVESASRANAPKSLAQAFFVVNLSDPLRRTAEAIFRSPHVSESTFDVFMGKESTDHEINGIVQSARLAAKNDSNQQYRLLPLMSLVDSYLNGKLKREASDIGKLLQVDPVAASNLECLIKRENISGNQLEAILSDLLHVKQRGHGDQAKQIGCHLKLALAGTERPGDLSGTLYSQILEFENANLRSAFIEIAANHNLTVKQYEAIALAYQTSSWKATIIDKLLSEKAASHLNSAEAIASSTLSDEKLAMLDRALKSKTILPDQVSLLLGEPGDSILKLTESGQLTDSSLVPRLLWDQDLTTFSKLIADGSMDCKTAARILNLLDDDHASCIRTLLRAQAAGDCVKLSSEELNSIISSFDIAIERSMKIDAKHHSNPALARLQNEALQSIEQLGRKVSLDEETLQQLHEFVRKGIKILHEDCGDQESLNKLRGFAIAGFEKQDLPVLLNQLKWLKDKADEPGKSEKAAVNLKLLIDGFPYSSTLIAAHMAGLPLEKRMRVFLHATNRNFAAELDSSQGAKLSADHSSPKGPAHKGEFDMTDTWRAAHAYEIEKKNLGNGAIVGIALPESIAQKLFPKAGEGLVIIDNEISRASQWGGSRGELLNCLVGNEYPVSRDKLDILREHAFFFNCTELIQAHQPSKGQLE